MLFLLVLTHLHAIFQSLQLMLCEDDYGNKYMLKAVSSNVGCWKSEEVLFVSTLSLLIHVPTVYHPNNKFNSL